MTHRAIEVVPCPDCGGMGYLVISADMASDAGDCEMAGQCWGCSRCNGGGAIQIEAEHQEAGTR